MTGKPVIKNIEWLKAFSGLSLSSPTSLQLN